MASVPALTYNNPKSPIQNPMATETNAPKPRAPTPGGSLLEMLMQLFGMSAKQPTQPVDAGFNPERPWESTALQASPSPSPTPTPSPSPTATPSMEEILALVDKLQQQRNVAKRLIPEQSWNTPQR